MGLRIIRARHPIGIDFIKERLNPSGAYESQEGMAEALKELLATKPQETYISIAFEEEPEKVLMFIAAIDGGQGTVLGLQTWMAPEATAFIANKMYSLFIGWCEANDTNFIQMENKRHPENELLSRGFIPLFTVYSLNLKPEVPNGSTDSDVQYVDEPTAADGKSAPGQGGTGRSSAESESSGDGELHQPERGDTAIAAV